MICSPSRSCQRARHGGHLAAAEVAPDDVVLEVDTGSGYQATILARLARKVCTIEIVPPLAEAAAKTLRDLA